MPTLTVPMPLSDPISTPRSRKVKPGQKDPNEGMLSDPWIPFFTNQNQVIQSVSQVLTPTVELTDQSASIGLTAIPTNTLSAGVYRVSYYVRVTQAAGTSSSIIVTLSWTDGGVSCGMSSAALTGNLTSTVGTGTAVTEIDASSPISYSTTYASVGAPVMKYKLTVILETL